MTNKHTATLPDGKIATRTSKSRIYSHCVAVRRSYDGELAAAKGYGALKVHANNHRYANECHAQGANHPHAKYITEETKAENARISGLSLEAYRAELTAEAIARVEAAKAKGAYAAWGVVGWNGRRDLAEKLAASYRTQAHIAEAVILETSIA